MTVIRHLLSLPGPRVPFPKGVGVAAWSHSDTGVGLIERLLAACEGDRVSGPALRTAGILGELDGRSGRQVTAWVARADVGAESGACVGLVTLVETATGFSVGWLVVHPAWRRRGLGRALVAVAAAAAHGRGATSLAAETLSGWPVASAFWTSLGSVDS